MPASSLRRHHLSATFEDDANLPPRRPVSHCHARLPAPAPLILTLDTDREWSAVGPAELLAEERPADMSDRWTFVHGRCSGADIAPGAGPRWATAATPNGPVVRCWDSAGRYVGVIPRDYALRALHAVGPASASEALFHREVR